MTFAVTVGIINQRGNVLLYLYLISSRVSMKLTKGTSINRGNLERMNLDFDFVRLVTLEVRHTSKIKWWVVYKSERGQPEIP